MEVQFQRISKKGKALFLAYDQGLEHGPTEFNDDNVDPMFIIDIAQKGGYDAVIFQKGIAEKYNKEIRESGVPLILKLNGKTNLFKGDPISKQLCTVDEAVNLGAVAVGYTIYIGSQHEEEMLEEFEHIEKEAHQKGMPVIAWVYPKGKSLEGRKKAELMAYAARVGLEIGADMVKIKYEGKKKDLAWAVKSAGRTKIVVAGGNKTTEAKFLKDAKEIMEAGVSGMAVGRNIWQSNDPLGLTQKLKEIIFK